MRVKMYYFITFARRNFFNLKLRRIFLHTSVYKIILVAILNILVGNKKYDDDIFLIPNEIIFVRLGVERFLAQFCYGSKEPRKGFATLVSRWLRDGDRAAPLHVHFCWIIHIIYIIVGIFT